MRITSERGGYFFNQCIAKHPKAKYSGFVPEWGYGIKRSASESGKTNVPLEQKMQNYFAMAQSS
jgi:hypothetical protein